MFNFQSILSLVPLGALQVVGDLLEPRPRPIRPNIAGINPPIAQAGVPAPVVFGTMKMPPLIVGVWGGREVPIATDSQGNPLTGVYSYGFDFVGVYAMAVDKMWDMTFDDKSVVQWSPPRTYTNSQGKQVTGPAIVTPPGSTAGGTVGVQFPIDATNMSTLPATLMINAPLLYGGPTAGGGVSQSWRDVFLGTATQLASAEYMRLAAGPGGTYVPRPNYPGWCYVVAYQAGTGVGGAVQPPLIVPGPGNVGNGTLGSYSAGSGNPNPETVLVTLTSSTAFTVFSLVSGALASGTVGTAYTSVAANFTVTAGGTAFAAGDTFQLLVRAVGAASNSGFFGTSPTPPVEHAILSRWPNALATLNGEPTVDDIVTQSALSTYDANPIECIYDIMTSANWPTSVSPLLNLATSQIDVASFQAAAATVFTEAPTGTDPAPPVPRTAGGGNQGIGVFTNIQGGFGPAETIEVEIISSTQFSVIGTVSGALADGFINQPYVGLIGTQQIIGFTLSNDTLSGDYWKFTMTPIQGAGVSFALGTDDSTAAEETIRQLLAIVNGGIYEDPETGLLTIYLCRGGYTLASLPVVDMTVCRDPTYNETSWPDTYNQLRVRYLERGFDSSAPVMVAGPAWTYRQASTMPLYNLASLDSSGGIPRVAEPLDYPEISNSLAAAVIQQRALQTCSIPRGQAEWKQNRTAHAFRPGQVVNYNWPAQGIANKAMRITHIDYGTLEEPWITIQATTDVYTLTPGSTLPPALLGSGATAPPPVTLVPTLIASPTTVTVAVGGTAQITVSSTQNGDTFTYTPASPAIATVSASGVVRGVAAGTTTVVITDPAGGSVTVTVIVTAGSTPVIQTPQLSPASVTVVVGDSVTLTSDSLDQNGNPIADTWTLVSSASGTASVSGMAITGVAVGSTTVVGTDSVSGTFTVNVTVVASGGGGGGGGGSEYAAVVAAGTTLGAALTALFGTTAQAAAAIRFRFKVDPLLVNVAQIPFTIAVGNSGGTAQTVAFVVETDGAGNCIIGSSANGTLGFGPYASILQSSLPAAGTPVVGYVFYDSATGGIAGVALGPDGSGGLYGSGTTALGGGGIGSGTCPTANDVLSIVADAEPLTLYGIEIQNQQISGWQSIPLSTLTSGARVLYTFDGQNLNEYASGPALTVTAGVTPTYTAETAGWGVQSVMSVTPTAITVRQGTTASVALAGGTGTITPTTTDDTIATATVSGSTATISAVNDGSATLTFTDSLGNTATVAVTVSSAASAPTTLSLTPSSATGLLGGPTIALKGAVTDQYGDLSAVTVGYVSGTPSVATVPSTGASGAAIAVTPVAQGSTIVTASYTGLTSATAAIRITSPVTAGNQVFGVKINSGFYGTGGLATTLVGLARDLHCACAVDICKWAALETASGVYDWTNTDLAFAAYAAAGITKVIWTFETVPSWTAGYGGSEYNYPTDPTDFTTLCGQAASFLTAFCNRYAGQIYAIEILNEPNQPYNWVPTPNVDFYIQLNNACHTAIKAADSSILVVSCSATGLVAGPSNAYTGLTFIQDFIDGGGLYDWVSIHPYPGGSGSPTVDNYPTDNSWDDVGRAVALVSPAPIAITEIGWSSASSSTIAGYMSYIGSSASTSYQPNSAQGNVAFMAVFCISDYIDANYGLYDSDNATIKLQGTAWQSFCESVGQ